MGTDIHGVFQKRVGDKWEDVKTKYEFDRHYLLFAWLGGVRNGYGFAGVRTHEPVVPIAAQRGFPADFEVDDEEHGSKWMGDHSWSWVSADEVLTAELPRIWRTGVIPVSDFETWDGHSAPTMWSGAVSGPNVKVVDARRMPVDGATHVQVSWLEETSESLAYFVDEVSRLKGLHGDVCFVFGFDS